MRDYAELIKQLRECGSRRDCLDCPYDNDASYCIEPRITEAADAIEELLAKVPTWISVEERLPDIGEIVLAYVDELGLIIRAKIVDAKDYRGERRIDWARVDKDPFFLSCYTVTHWMLLPAPPKEDV